VTGIWAAAAIGEAVLLAVLVAIVWRLRRRWRPRTAARRGQPRRLSGWLRRVDPDAVPKTAIVPVIVLLLASGMWRPGWPYLAGAIVLAVAALLAQGWLQRRVRREHQEAVLDAMQQLYNADPIDDGDRNARRPPEEES
jgi:hypothetical protein